VIGQTRLRGPDEQFCRNCGALNKRTNNFCVSCGIPLLVPDAGAQFIPVAPLEGQDAAITPYPVRFDVEYPERLSRLTTFVRLILAVPQLLIVYALGSVVSIVTFIAWFAILFTRRYPKGLFELVVSFNRWSANVYAYVALLRDEYPPFSTDAGKYPVTYEVDYPERLSRWLIFVKWLLVIPHQIFLNLLLLIGLVFGIVAWLAILLTGRYPKGLFSFNSGLLRWYLRVGAYSGLLRDEFPPYSKRPDARPASGRAIAVSAVLAFPAMAALATVYAAAFLGFFAIASHTEEVQVSYTSITTGEAGALVDIGGVAVTLIRAEDPTSKTLPPSSQTQRFVSFDLRVTNRNGLFAFVGDRSFSLTESSGRKVSPNFVRGGAPGGGEFLVQGETALVTAVFLVEEGPPRSLTYSPGFAAFLPFGDEVRFVFR